MSSTGLKALSMLALAVLICASTAARVSSMLPNVEGGGKALWTVITTSPNLSWGQPGGKIDRAPENVMGTTGAWVRWLRANGPGLKGPKRPPSPLDFRVPSGKFKM